MSTDTATKPVTKPKATRKRTAAKATPVEQPASETVEVSANPTPDEIAAMLGITERGNVGRPISEVTLKVYAELDNVKVIAGNTFASVLYANVGIEPTDKGKQKLYRCVNSWIDKRAAEHGENWGIDRKISGKDGYALRLIPTEN